MARIARVLPAVAAVAAAAIPALVALAPAPARAGNAFTFPAGSRAAAMSGACAALADDPASAWWNPAGLGWTERSSLDVSASAYTLQMLRIPEFLRTTLPSGVYPSSFSASPFQVVASSLTYVWKIGGWRPEVPAAPATTTGTPASDAPAAPSPARNAVEHAVAFSVFVPVSQKFSQSAAFDTQEPGGPFHQRFSLASQSSVYYIGPSWGARIGDRISVGASLFGIYSTGDARATFAVDTFGVPPGETAARHVFSTFGADVSSTQIGLAIHLGAQFRPISGLRIGVGLRLPGLRVWGRTTGTTLKTASVDETGALAPSFEDTNVREGSGAAFAWPFTLTVGLAWQTPGVFAIALDADYTTAWHWGGNRTRNHFNGRLGIEVNLAPRWLLGFGGFTDVTPAPSFGNAANETFIDVRMSFYGGTLGVTYLSPYVVVGSGKTDRITFATTVGFKYAYGTGQVVGMDVDYTGGYSGNALKAVHAHEISLLVGTGVRF